MRFVLALLLLATLGACATTQPARQLANVMTQEHMQALLNADVILLGEQHDNPHHHAIQQQVLDFLGQKGVLGTLVFEQIHWDQQAIVDGLNNRSLGELEKDLGWSSSGWPAFALYEPLFTAAVRYRTQIVAGNLPALKNKAIHQSGYAAAFTLDEQKKLGLDQELPTKALDSMKKAIFDGHCQMVPIDHVKAMVPVQRARDAAMALAWRRLHKTGKSVFIVGAGHARSDFGIPWYLKQYNPALKIYSIGMNEGESPDDASAFDQQITTAAPERQDPCVGLKEKFSAPKS